MFPYFSFLFFFKVIELGNFQKVFKFSVIKKNLKKWIFQTCKWDQFFKLSNNPFVYFYNYLGSHTMTK